MTSKPSDILPAPDIGQGDADSAAIFTEVGRALSSWESVEEGLADMFAILMGGTPQGLGSPSRRAYGAIATFRARTEMLKAAAQAFFRDRTDLGSLAQLKSHLRNCTDFSARRNEIAHGVVKTLSAPSDDPRLRGGILDDTWYLMPASYNTTKSHIIPSNISIARNGRTDAEVTSHVLVKISELVKQGSGKFKYNSTQISYYNDRFVELSASGEILVNALVK